MVRPSRSALVTLILSAVLPSVATAASLDAPGFYHGSSGVNSNFTVLKTGNLELGLRASLYGDATDAPVVGNTYFVPTGMSPLDSSRAAWNFDFSINTRAGGGNSDLGSYGRFDLAISDNNTHATEVVPLLYWSDNSYWNGAKHVGNLNYGTDYGAQNSENPTFGNFPLKNVSGYSYNPLAAGTYTFTLEAYSYFTPSEIFAFDTIYINISDNPAAAAAAFSGPAVTSFNVSDNFAPAAVPVPAAAWTGLSLLGGIGFLRLRKNRPK